MKSQNFLTAHLGRARVFPRELLGDWRDNSDQRIRIRFNYDATLSLVIEVDYSISQDQGTLKLPIDPPYIRQSGTTGLPGRWRSLISTSDWFEITFGPLGLYAFEWEDGLVGGGFYESSGQHLVMIEHRRNVCVDGSTITFRDGDETQSATYAIRGDQLSLRFSDRVDTYTKLPLTTG